MNEKAIELLEEAKCHLSPLVPVLSHHPLNAVYKCIKEALALLSSKPEPKCETCRDTKKVDQQFNDYGKPHCGRRFLEIQTRKIPCPKCQQPEPTEFTKKLRRNVLNFPDFPEHLRDLLKRDIFKACDIIERQAEELKEKAIEQPEPTEITKKFDEYQDVVHSIMHILQKKKILTGTGFTCEDIKREILHLINRQAEEIKRLEEVKRIAKIALEAIKIRTKPRPHLDDKGDKPIWIAAKCGLEEINQTRKEKK